MKAHDRDHASDNGSFSNVAMNGSEVFKFAVRAVPAVSEAESNDMQDQMQTFRWQMSGCKAKHI